ncbi:MAG: winged helix-turn-helix domain-containing protein [Pyrinomonadaceae bacterium]
MSRQVKQLYEFGPFRLDTSERVLMRDGAHVPLTPKAYETLLALVRRSGHVMEKDELLREIWPDTFVEEATLAQNVFTLRKALGNGQNNGQRYIETIPRRGYRFAAGVRELTDAAAKNGAGVETEAGAFPAAGGMPHVENGLSSADAGHDPTGVPEFAGSSVPAAVQNIGHRGERVGRPLLGAVVISLAVVVAASAVIYALIKLVVREQAAPPTASSAAPFQTMKVTRLPINGKVEEAVISPDGRYVAYMVEDAGRDSVWVRQVAAASSAQQIVPPGDSQYGGITFSHDSEYIYYAGWKGGRDEPSALYQMPVLGGAARKILTRINSYVSLSPDGRQLAFIRVNFDKPDPETEMIIANADGTDERTLARRTAPDHLGAPAWSPDGRVIAIPFRSFEPSPGHATVIEVSVADGAERPITSRRWYQIGKLVWLPDGSGLVANVAEEELSPMQLWELSYPEGSARKITNDLNSYHGVSLSADAGALVALQGDLVSNVWVAPAADAGRAAQVTHGAGKYDGYYGLSWAPDGRIIYSSVASGAWDIWVMNADGTGQKQLTVGARSNYGASVSPDGRHVVFISNRAGGPFNVWRMDPDGGNPRQLTSGRGENFAHVTPDGKWVVYASVGFTEPNYIWKVPIEGGEPVRLTDKRSSWPFVSPDGRHVVCIYLPEPNKPYKLALVPIEGGAPVKLFDLPSNFRANTVFMPDGRGVSYIANRDGVNNLWMQPLDGGPPKQLTDFKTEGVIAYDWSRDGRRLACSRGVETTSVVMIKDFR